MSVVKKCVELEKNEEILAELPRRACAKRMILVQAAEEA